ncbi:DUF4034 domain-containing protein [Arsenicibacter rosenii]|uniref:DUF4034 domain-containing protein n=1 Tax=Arsenicibacter rosenii TaxID=1750698 RepID=A0A1S2VE54_9BACT|nr:DUF4034 domain-containing protein [Arsenicibacter rosenii]OIN56555.1 hypothetical protein BLX24_24100 [Arsenicibacter rosenii]
MSFFKRLFSPKAVAVPKSGKPDNTLGFEQILLFTGLAEKGDFPTLEEAYRTAPWHEQSLIIEGLANQPDAQANLLEAWMGKRPDAHLPFLLMGAILTKEAWDARSSKLAKDVSPEQASAFFDLLKSARAALMEAIERDGNDPQCYSRMLPVLMGLEEEEEVLMAYFRQAKTLVPSHLGAHMAMLNALTPKWGGSHEQMDTFLTTYCDVKTWPLLTGVHLSAMLEKWIQLNFDGQEEAFRTYFDDAQRKQTVLALYKAYTDPENVGLQTYITRNYFALLLIRTGEKELARQEIRKLEGRMTMMPWKLVGIHNYATLSRL